MRAFCAACSASSFLCSARLGLGGLCKSVHSVTSLRAASRMSESTEVFSLTFPHRVANMGAGVASNSCFVYAMRRILHPKEKGR
jgi:hypothetical protein